MDIIIFSNGSGTEKMFSAVDKSKLFNVRICPVSELKKILKNDSPVFAYLDIRDMTDAEMKKHIAYLAGLKNTGCGIIDIQGRIADPAGLFFSGVSDYVSRELCSRGVTAARIRSAVMYGKKNGDGICSPGDGTAKKYILSGDGWGSVRAGYEYTFVFMFIELDRIEKIKKHGPDQAEKITVMFQNYLASVVEHLNGRIWIWTDFGGLVLFPFNGRECAAVVQAFKLMLNNRIINSETFRLDLLLTYRIVMDLGNTVYKKRGDTGTIVSDSINSIFHLGRQFAEEARFYVGRDLFRYVPKGLARCFISAGEFEGREVMRMLSLR
jgi:hypothetical protein